MKTRRIIICLVVLAIFTSFAFASTNANTSRIDLSFSGTTAICSMTVIATGKTINATLELWKGNQLIQTWSASGTSSVRISETKTVNSGSSYTLKGSYYENGVYNSIPSITKVCQ